MLNAFINAFVRTLAHKRSLEVCQDITP